MTRKKTINGGLLNAAGMLHIPSPVVASNEARSLPSRLYHGTSAIFASSIQRHGLRALRRIECPHHPEPNCVHTSTAPDVCIGYMASKTAHWLKYRNDPWWKRNYAEFIDQLPDTDVGRRVLERIEDDPAFGVLITIRTADLPRRSLKRDYDDRPDDEDNEPSPLRPGGLSVSDDRFRRSEGEIAFGYYSTAGIPPSALSFDLVDIPELRDPQKIDWIVEWSAQNLERGKRRLAAQGRPSDYQPRR